MLLTSQTINGNKYQTINRNSQVYMDFSIAESRFCYKFAEIFSGPFAKDRISRV